MDGVKPSLRLTKPGSPGPPRAAGTVQFLLAQRRRGAEENNFTSAPLRLCAKKCSFAATMGCSFGLVRSWRRLTQIGLLPQTCVFCHACRICTLLCCGVGCCFLSGNQEAGKDWQCIVPAFLISRLKALPAGTAVPIVSFFSRRGAGARRENGFLSAPLRPCAKKYSLAASRASASVLSAVGAD